MSRILSLQYESLIPNGNPSCRDLIDFLDELDDLGLDINVGKFSRFVISNSSLDLDIPEDFDYADDNDVAKLLVIESRTGPWFEITEGLQVMQAITKEILMKYKKEDHPTRSIEDLFEIAVPTLKKFQLALRRKLNSGKSNRFRINSD
jgi:hypothetical protein